MKKYILCLSLLLPLFAGAQLKLIAEGPSFTEPESGEARILMLKNGNTAYVRVTPKDGIDIRLYDPQHKEIVVKTIEPEYGKLRAMNVEALYDINNELNIFINEVQEKTPTLYRLRVDAQTGVLKELKTIATLNKTNMGQGYAMAFGEVPPPDFLLRKDRASENYGVVRYNTFEKDRTQRVELIQYGVDGSETARTFLSSPDAKYKFTQILDFVILGNEAYVLLYSYNTAHSGGAANELLLATVKDGKVAYDNIGQSIKHRINYGVLEFNPVTHNLVFLTSEYLKTKHKGLSKSENIYNVVLNVIDLQQKTIKANIPLRQSSLLAKYRKVFKDNELSIMPQEVYVNEDGSITLLLEDILKKTYTTTSVRPNMAPRSRTRTTVTLRSSAVLNYNEDGTENYSVLVPKSHAITPVMFGNASTGTSRNGISHLNAGNQFKGVFYLNGKKRTYILMNDVAENSERIAKGKLTTISGVGDCEAWCYDLSTMVSSALPIPQRTALFEKERSKDRNMGLFNLSDFNRESGVLAMLKLERGKGVKLVWMAE